LICLTDANHHWQPENRHVKFNVDVKVQNDPERLFTLMHKTISDQPGWETELAPRILLGLWHPRFVAPAKTHLPYLRRSYIGNSVSIARKYFWDNVDAFSIAFPTLATMDGQRWVISVFVMPLGVDVSLGWKRFRAECKAAGKQVMVWTVNDPAQMMEAVRWGVDAILTDVTKTWIDLRAALRGALVPFPRTCSWR
jgi:glycerophosphoryl diester phosphodiesterase